MAFISGKSKLILAATLFVAVHAHADTDGIRIDADAAQTLARRESCLKCHGIDKRKDGPSYKEVAKKYRDKPDAEARLIKHVTSGEVVKLPSGDEDEHRVVKTKDENELRNLIRWILSL